MIGSCKLYRTERSSPALASGRTGYSKMGFELSARGAQQQPAEEGGQGKARKKALAAHRSHYNEFRRTAQPRHLHLILSGQT
jgi:hypothetical protein